MMSIVRKKRGGRRDHTYPVRLDQKGGAEEGEEGGGEDGGAEGGEDRMKRERRGRIRLGQV